MNLPDKEPRAMLELESLGEHYDDSTVLRDFSLPESKALVDLAYLMIMIDREVNDEELAKLRTQLEKLPFASKEQARATLANHIKRTRQALSNIIEKPDSVDEYIENTAGRIQPPEHRRVTLEILSLLSYADAPHPSEANVYHRVGRAFGFDEQKLEETWAAAGDH